MTIIHELYDMQHEPWSVPVLLRHVIQLLAQLLEKRLEVFKPSVPQMMDKRPVRQHNIWFELAAKTKMTRGRPVKLNMYGVLKMVRAYLKSTRSDGNNIGTNLFLCSLPMK